MAGITDSLTQDLGPLPVWAWGAVIGGGIGIGAFINSRRSSKPTGVVASTPDYGPASIYGETGLSPTQGYSGGQQSAGGSDFNYTKVYSSNLEWRQDALRIAQKIGFTSLAADAIITDYLDGVQLTTEQQSLINPVIAAIGLPPVPPTTQTTTVPQADDGTTILPEQYIVAQILSEELGYPPNQIPPADDYWVVELQKSNVGVNDIRYAIANSQEAKNKGYNASKAPQLTQQQQIVRQAYLAELGREPDAGGLAYWANELAKGSVNQSNLRSYIRASAEGQRVG